MFWIAQALAVGVCIMTSLSYLAKQKKTYLMEQVAANSLYCAQYILLGAYAGAISNVLTIVKLIVCYFNEKKGKGNPTWQALLFCGLSIVLGVFAIKGWYSVIPIVNAVIFTLGIWQDNPIFLRVMAGICSLLWIVFNFAVGAYVAAAYSAVEFIVVVVTMVKLIRQSKTQKQEP